MSGNGAGLESWLSWTGCSSHTTIAAVYNDSSASTWSALDDINYMVSQYPAGMPLVWSLATYPTSATLASVAAGAGNSYYATWASQLLAAGRAAPDGNIYVRPNWEVPATYFRWGSDCAASPTNCIAAFRQIAGVFHAASPKFKMVWDTFPIYGEGYDNSVYYPGDSYVDVVAQDFYPYDSGSANPTAGWSYDLTVENGLNWLQAFSKAHGKPMATNEWGLASNDQAPVVADVYSWFQTNHYVYASYFDSGTTQLDNNAYPTTGAAFQHSYCATP